MPSEPAKPITLIPVGLKEAALDSPTFRSEFTHFVEQLDLVEKWLSSYYRCIAKVSHEVAPFESAINVFLSQTVPPLHVSEAVLDHDYTLLALKRYGECAKDFWTATLSGLRKMEANMVDPIKAFLQGDLQSFKDLKRGVESTQKQLDSLQSRYASQAKTKEPSSLREEAFQLHETRRAYLKASMDFSVGAPQLRMKLDKLLVKVFSDQWRDMRDPRMNFSATIAKWGGDIERVRGWSQELEKGEKTFRQELEKARKQIEENSETLVRPSRELEDYAQKSASLSSTQIPSNRPRNSKGEKQGWLMLRTVTGKPSRTTWLRRWFYVKNGIFGWLIQGSRSGAVEESDRIGVLLCNVRSASSDDRRFIFEVKTKDTTLVIQAETQTELDDWLSAFEIAKQKALETPAKFDSSAFGQKNTDPAFSISPPSAPEFAASLADSGALQAIDDGQNLGGVDRSSTLPVPGADLSTRNSFDVNNSRRSSGIDGNNEGTRERLMSKLDLHKRSTGGLSGSSSGGGIASLIAASHGSMPVGPGAPPPTTPDTPTMRKVSTPLSTIREMPTSSLAPSTLANPPAPTNLSATAVVVNGERGIGLSRPDSSGGLPSGFLANVWGSSNWGFLNRLERGEVDDGKRTFVVASQQVPTASGTDHSNAPTPQDPQKSPSISPAVTPTHRKTISLDGDDSAGLESQKNTVLEYPNYYPLQLKAQDAQFRLLFPDIGRDERVVYVFKATWNPNDQQEFPGRVYVTPKEIFFYSNHCGMTMTTSLQLKSIDEVTAANGRDWDVIFLHLKEPTGSSGFTRITIKTFLEPVKLVQRRLSFLVRNSAEISTSIEEIMKTLIKMEQDDSGGSPSENSWENVSINTPVDGTPQANRLATQRDHRDLRTNVLIDRGLFGEASEPDNGRQAKPFKLPKQPVIFVPSNMDQLVVEKEFDVSPKALFHVMFGDRSAVWQLLYHERQAQHIRQGPWTQPAKGHLRRDFEYEIEYLDMLRRVRVAPVQDHQVLDSATEHLLYCVSDRKTPWHLPLRKEFVLLSKIVIAHVAKSRCKLTIYVKIDWTRKTLPLASSLITRAALQDMKTDALDLSDVLSDQVRKLVGVHSRTKKAISIFGKVGQQTQVSEFAGSDSPLNARLRRSRVRRSLTSIYLQGLGSFAETVATSILQIVGNFIEWLWNTFTANSVVLLLLGSSVLFNFYFSSRGSAEWWRERKAVKYMASLGVSSDGTMSKAIYVNHIEDATSLETPDETSGSQCRDAFDSIMNIGDPLTSIPSPGSAQQTRTPQSLHYQNTRQHLGTRRHDLMVAMRVVNSIERELIRGEWERWLVEETTRCRQLGTLLKANTTDGPDTGLGRLQANKEALTHWYESYCPSCEEEGAMAVRL
ncbi:uncharacterized protein KY384_000974 [Bacidia gigantensis]|uniref:uncharacterized protein n=1 Tax=Bacidia gigantensis TaxID=2732470 RepID=UPI001D055701|nr:uncharacterized protein KY384_000974 [Bacidia gigantensis]KAG8534130.1 hypothetical protein KY384_000974 [Bacidia gigantensis]